jgi:hypothetical protein
MTPYLRIVSQNVFLSGVVVSSVWFICELVSLITLS